MNTGLASGSVSATVLTQESLKAFRAIEKYEKDSILLFLHYYKPIICHIFEKQSTRNNVMMLRFYFKNCARYFLF